MLRLPAETRIFAMTKPVHGRKELDGLVRLVRTQLGKDPFTGDLFVFFNKRWDRVKLLVWDRNGFWLVVKRLERGRFERIDLKEPMVELDRSQLAMLLEGIDTRTWRFGRNFEREVRISSRDDEGEQSRTSE